MISTFSQFHFSLWWWRMKNRIEMNRQSRYNQYLQIVLYDDDDWKKNEILKKKVEKIYVIFWLRALYHTISCSMQKKFKLMNFCDTRMCWPWMESLFHIPISKAEPNVGFCAFFSNFTLINVNVQIQQLISKFMFFFCNRIWQKTSWYQRWHWQNETLSQWKSQQWKSQQWKSQQWKSQQWKSQQCESQNCESQNVKTQHSLFRC